MTEKYSITYIAGLTPKIVFRNGIFMFPKKEADNIAKELSKKYPDVKFTVSKMPNIK